jgi:hypothetical protein
MVAAPGGIHAPRVGPAQTLAERARDGERHLGLTAHQPQEACAIESQHLGALVGAHGRRARLTAEQSHFSERGPGLEGIDAPLGRAAPSRHVDAEGATDDQVERIARIALPEHGGARIDGNGLEVGGKLGERDPIQPREEIDAGEEVGVLEPELRANRHGPRGA